MSVASIRNYYYQATNLEQAGGGIVIPAIPDPITSDIVVVCGAECQIDSVGTTTSEQNKHWGEAQGTPTISTSVARNGNCSYQFAAASPVPYLARECAASKAVGYIRGYFRISGNPSTDTTIVYFSPTSGTNAGIEILSNGVISGFIAGSGFTDGPTLSADTWYGIEVQLDASENPNRLKWRLWQSGTGWTDMGDVTSAQSAHDITTIRFGMISGPSSGWTINWDDIMIGESETPDVDYGEVGRSGKVLSYNPSADLTHAFDTGDFEYNNTTGISSSATDIWSYIDEDDHEAGTDFISQVVAGTGKYIQCEFESAVETNNPTHVAVTSTHAGASGATSRMNLRVSDNGTDWQNIWGDWTTGYTANSTGHAYLHKVLPNTPSGDGWYKDALNGMRFQWGGAESISTPSFLHAISLEVEWPE